MQTCMKKDGGHQDMLEEEEGKGSGMKRDHKMCYICVPTPYKECKHCILQTYTTNNTEKCLKC